jgi:hypothetical protein
LGKYESDTYAIKVVDAYSIAQLRQIAMCRARVRRAPSVSSAGANPTFARIKAAVAA